MLPPSPPAAPVARIAQWLLAVLPVLLAVWTFAGTLDAFFTQDDFWFLEAIARPWPDRAMLGGALLPDYVRPLPTYWWPLGNQALFGLDPWGFHLTQLLLHGATVHALYRALRGFTGAPLAAALGATLYGLAQVHPFTLGWISGAIDGLAACGFAHALWALAALRNGTGRAALVVGAFGAALLAKEHAIVLPAAAWLAARVRPAPGAPRTAEVARGGRLWLGFAVVTALYAIGWFLLTREAPPTTGRTFGFDLGRTVQVLRDSAMVVNPLVPHDRQVGRWHAALPVGLLAIALVRQRTWRAPLTWFAALLWVLPALVFTFTARPEHLQPYYAHFSVFGLALLVAQLLALRPGSPSHRLASGAVLGLGIVYTIAAANLGRELVAGHRSPALFQAQRSGLAQQQLAPLLSAPGVREVWLFGVDDGLWWALGKGAQLRVLFPGVVATFSGHDADLPADATSTAARLVLRWQPATGFTAVR